MCCIPLIVRSEVPACKVALSWHWLWPWPWGLILILIQPESNWVHWATHWRHSCLSTVVISAHSVPTVRNDRRGYSSPPLLFPHPSFSFSSPSFPIPPSVSTPLPFLPLLPLPLPQLPPFSCFPLPFPLSCHKSIQDVRTIVLSPRTGVATHCEKWPQAHFAPSSRPPSMNTQGCNNALWIDGEHEDNMRRVHSGTYSLTDSSHFALFINLLTPQLISC